MDVAWAALGMVSDLQIRSCLNISNDCFTLSYLDYYAASYMMIMRT